MNEELLKSYEELKRNRNIINKIEPDFFFEIVDCLLKENREIKMDRDKFKKANELFGKYNFEQIKFAVDALQELLEGREKYDRGRKESC